MTGHQEASLAARSLTQFIWQILKKHRFYLLFFTLPALFWGVNNTLQPYVLKIIIDQAVSYQGNAPAVFAAIKPYIGIYIFLWATLCLDMRFLDWLRLRVYPNLRQETIATMFDYLTRHSQHYFQNHFAAGLVNKIVDMQNGLTQILRIVEESYIQFLRLLIAIVVLFAVHPIFALILVVWLLTFLAITVAFSKPIRHLSLIYSHARTQLIGNMVDSISNISTVRLFAKRSLEKAYLNESIQKTVVQERAMEGKIIQMRLLWDLSIVVLVGVNLWTLGSMYARHAVTLGDFGFIITLSISILWNIWFMAVQFVSFSDQIGKCKQALSLVNTPHEIVDDPAAKPLTTPKGEITFEEVSFHYGKKKRLFQNKNIVIAPGEKVGLVGFSGSGKSTFVNLILRLFEVESGRILIDGQPLTSLTQDSVHQHIAFIPQDVSLFHRTLMENIRYGAEGASDEAVIAAAKTANCHDFIMQLDEGYQTIVGDRGIKLSAGQRQRIAIARAVLKNAPILILDEATSALDSVTEQVIQTALHDLMKEKTTIVIAHRLSTLSQMDRILVFDNGKIIESGSQKKLLEQNGHYARMWAMQAGGFLPPSQATE